MAISHGIYQISVQLAIPALVQPPVVCFRIQPVDP